MAPPGTTPPARCGDTVPVGNLLAIVAAALFLALVGTPAMRVVARRLGVLDQPAGRKLHTQPVPLLGGIAIYGAVVGSLLLLPDRREVLQLAAIVLAATWVSLWGLWDDRRPLPPIAKLLAQITAAAILAAGGIQVAMRLPDWANVALTVLWVVGITNAFNLLDNMDGLAGGVGATAAAYFLLMAAMNGQVLVSALAAATLGACLGFLFYNFNPASIFMGDSGSLFLGLVMAALGIKLRFPANVSWVTWMVPVLVLGVPILDTTLVVVSRLRRGVNPFTTPGKDHISHRLVRLGWTRREAVLVLLLAGSALGVLAMFVSLASLTEAYAIAAASLLAAAAILAWLEIHAGPSADLPAPTGYGSVS
jgi:UDP-GlcNAc:undecaprenyl-phosphate GlcNAc-1-phosphate transferase